MKSIINFGVKKKILDKETAEQIAILLNNINKDK
jgi:hypothetical protein